MHGHKLTIKYANKMVESELVNKNKERYWDLYLVLYSKMTKETFISFDDFYKESFSNYSEVSDEDILNELLPIIENHEKR